LTNKSPYKTADAIANHAKALNVELIRVANGCVLHPFGRGAKHGRSSRKLSLAFRYGILSAEVRDDLLIKVDKPPAEQSPGVSLHQNA